MSATNRGRPRSDNYETPAWCVDALLDALDLPEDEGGAWLEPCAGHGAIIRAVQARYPAITWRAVEVRPECRPRLAGLNSPSSPVYVQIDDFLDPDCRARRAHYGVAITNPPFSRAIEVAQACLPLATSTILLLRLSWLAGIKRHPWLKIHTPSALVLSKRPSFDGAGTDATDYAWMIWGRFAESKCFEGGGRLAVIMPPR